MSNPIVVVCGFGRCGTTLVMRMLYAGGLEVYAENRTSFEVDAVLGLPDDPGFLAECSGRALKVLDPHVFQVPREYVYRFVWLDRNPRQQALSQAKLFEAFLGLKQKSHEIRRVRQSLVHDRPRALALLRSYENSKLLILRFADVLADPTLVAARLTTFVGRELDVGVMAACVVPREPKCLPYMLELGLLEGARNA